MFSNTHRACATTSSPPTSSRRSSTGTMPETKRNPPASTASVKCEIGSAWPATRSSRRSAHRSGTTILARACSRISVSVCRGVSASGSTRSSISAGRPQPSASSKRGGEVLRPLDRDTVSAERPRERGEVGVDEIGAGDAARIVPLLVHPDRPVHAVVDDEDDDRRLVLHRGRELLPGHQEVAVAGDRDDDPLRDGRSSPRRPPEPRSPSRRSSARAASGTA